MAETVALIPARGGSKGLPRKNLAVLGGKPLIAWTIEAASKAATLGRVFVSTEDDEIADVAARYGATVIDRPPVLAGDDTRTEDVVLHALDHLAAQEEGAEFVALLQPTSPLRNETHIDQLIGGARQAGARCAWSVTPTAHHPWKMLVKQDGMLEPVAGVDDLSAPRQSLPSAYRQNGAIYWLACDLFRRHRTFFVPPVHAFEMTADESVDIDTADDLRHCQSLLERD
jgi:CMP-N-acetylneuraminic acid synthetase